MTDSLMTALATYKPTEGRRPIEDFITEAWAWLLRNTPGLWSRFEGELRAVAKGEQRAYARRSDTPPALPRNVRPESVETQFAAEAKRVDMVAAGDSIDDGLWLFEHKVHASEGEQQLAGYRRWADAHRSKRGVVVYVTASPAAWSREPETAHLQITWAFVEQVCRAQVDAAEDGLALVDDFLALLEAEGLGAPPELSVAGLEAYEAAQRVVPALRRVWLDLQARDWSWLYERLPDAKQPEPTPRQPYTRWRRDGTGSDGRFGLDFYHCWKPGLFFGVLLDPRDHRVRPSHPSAGPDLCVILSYHAFDATEPTTHAFHGSPEFAALRRRLAATCAPSESPWNFEDHVTAKPRNAWHPIHLRRPLSWVIAGAHDPAARADRILEAGRQMIELLLGDADGGGELERWARRVGPRAPGSSPSDAESS